MKIVVATPLYPPDVAEIARDVKELVRRLATLHTVTVITYGRFPEQVTGVTIISVDARRSLPIRLFFFMRATLESLFRSDVIILQNGPSAELPVIVAAFFTGKPLILRLGDEVARCRSGWTERLARFKSVAVVERRSVPRPEILPFVAPPDFSEYESSWEEHIAEIEHHLYDSRRK